MTSKLSLVSIVGLHSLLNCFFSLFYNVSASPTLLCKTNDFFTLPFFSLLWIPRKENFSFYKFYRWRFVFVVYSFSVVVRSVERLLIVFLQIRMCQRDSLQRFLITFTPTAFGRPSSPNILPQPLHPFPFPTFHSHSFEKKFSFLVLTLSSLVQIHPLPPPAFSFWQRNFPYNILLPFMLNFTSSLLKLTHILIEKL